MQNLFRTDGWVKSTQGPAVPGAQVFVCTQPANTASFPPSPLAPTYADPGGLIPLAQPIITDGFGHYDFYTVAGLYTVVVANGGLIQQVYPDQSVGGIGTGGTGSTLTLENNGVANGSQKLLNLVAGQNISIVDDGEGDITISSSGASFDGEGAYFFGPGITDLPSIIQTAWGLVVPSGVNGSTTDNLVVVYKFQLLAEFMVSRATIACSDDSFGNSANFGIYNAAGTKVLDTGSFAANSTLAQQTNTFTPVTLSPGVYWHAQASTGGQRYTGIEENSGSGNQAPMAAFVKNATRVAYSSNSLAGGALPATLGTLTAFTPNGSDGDGFCAPLYE